MKYMPITSRNSNWIVLSADMLGKFKVNQSSKVLDKQSLVLGSLVICKSISILNAPWTAKSENMTLLDILANHRNDNVNIG